MTQRKLPPSLVRRPLLAAALVASATVPAPAVAAFDAFIKLDGISGESTDAKHKDWIEIFSFSEGAGSRAGSGEGGGASSNCQLRFEKAIDKASPILWSETSERTVHKTAELDLVSLILSPTIKNSGNTFLSYKFNDLIINSVQQSGASTDAGLPTEIVSLNYGSVEWTYTTQNVDGSAGTPITGTANCRSGSDR